MNDGNAKVHSPENDDDQSLQRPGLKGSTSEDNYDSDKFGICQWISFGIMTAILIFLIAFVIYEFSTWNEPWINKYGWGYHTTTGAYNLS